MRQMPTPKSFLSTQFDRARLKLTLLYLGISGCIVILFSIAALNAQRYAVDRVLSVLESRAGITERQLVSSLLGQRLEQFDLAFKQRLLMVNIALLIGAGVASYFLSGASLRSIRENVESQEEFAADASHELRTPLTTISMEIVALQKTHKRLPAPVKETLQSVQQEVRRMQEIVDGLLTLVRDDQDKLVGRQLIDLNQMWAESVKQMQPLAKDKHIALKTQLSKDPLLVHVTPDQVKQLFLILLDNAIKYTPKGGSVTITTNQKGRTVLASIEDTGVGIPAADLPHVFDRFYRVQRFDSSSTRGAGLGLTIAHKLVENADGHIQVASTMGVGTRVNLRFPKVS